MLTPTAAQLKGYYVKLPVTHLTESAVHYTSCALVHPRTLYRKTVQENVDDDICTKTVFPGPTMEERKDLETGLLAVEPFATQ